MSKKQQQHKRRPSTVANVKVVAKLTEAQRTALVGLRQLIAQMEQRHSQLVCNALALAEQIAVQKKKLQDMGISMLGAHGVDSSKMAGVRINEQTGEVEEEPVLALASSSL